MATFLRDVMKANTMDITQLATSEYAPYFQPYMDQVGQGDLFDLLEDQRIQMKQMFAGMSGETAAAVHPPYSWSIKQVLAHMLDTEKIFGCRAHRIACGDQTQLPGFDQDQLVANYDYESTPVSELIQEFEALRSMHEIFFRRLNVDAWSRTGNCDNKQISVRAIAFLLIGHANHHLQILKQRLK